MTRLMLALAFALVMALPDARAEETRPPPAAGTPSVARDIDALFLLQDATARGRKDAEVLQKSLLMSIGETLMNGPGEEPRRIWAHVAAYVLSGGDPRTADKLAAVEELDPVQRSVLAGAAEFMRGERNKASKHLSKINPVLLPARLGGRVALAQSLLATEPAERQKALSIAASAMPGTLIEEAALRRSTLAYAEQAEEPSFWKRLERYQRRFPMSIYAPAFWDDIMDNILIWTGKGSSFSLPRLDLVMASMDTAKRRTLYLQLARKSAAAGNVDVLEYAAARARRLSEENSQEDQAARLYLSLFAITTDRGAQVLRDLQSINPGLLTPRERALRDAALSIGQQIDEPLDSSSGSTMMDNETTPLKTKAEEILSEVDALLAELGS